MQIVIKIPDKLYETIISDEYGVHQGCIYDIIRNGTPLPKGHGRLIDADALIDTLGCSDRDIYAKECIEEDAPTIIEAESEENI